MKQLALEWASAPAPTLENFIVGDNAEAVSVLRHLGAPGGERFVYLWGGSGCGCTHLLRGVVDAARARGAPVQFIAAGESIAAAEIAEGMVFVVDDVQQLPPRGQINLFNIFNNLSDSPGVLLTAGDVVPARLPLRPDLLTRLAAGLVYEVRTLSDEARRSALCDHAAARGFALPPEVLDYLLTRMPRDLRSLRAVVDLLDRRSLEQKRPVTVPLARELLHTLQQT